MGSSLTSLANSLILSPDGVSEVIKVDFDTKDIINLIIAVDGINDHQAAREVAHFAPHLKGRSDRDTLYNIWSFVRFNIKYTADGIRYEDVKTPAQTWASGYADCKSMSIFVGALLRNFDFGYSYRFAGYDDSGEFNHVYVIAHTRMGNIIIDPVFDKFNREEKYTIFKDYKMRELRYIHGLPSAPNVITQKAAPSRIEAFRDGPKKAIVLPPIDESKFTQSALALELAKRQINILSAYYGDPRGNFSKALELISKSKRLGLQNIYFDGVISPELYPVVSLIKHAQSIDTPVSLNGLTEDVMKCVAQHNPATANWVERIGKKTNVHHTEEINGTHYRLTNQDFANCYFEAKRREFARLNIFSSPDFKKSGHHMLYAFIHNTKINTAASGALSAKKVLHNAAVSGWANVSAYDRTNVELFIRNNISEINAAQKQVDITPEGSINLLSISPDYKGQPGIGEPVTAATTVLIIKLVIAILGAATAIIGALAASGAFNAATIRGAAAGIGHPTFGPEIDDMLKAEIKSETSTMNTGLIVGAAALAVGSYFFFNSKKSKND